MAIQIFIRGRGPAPLGGRARSIDGDAPVDGIDPLSVAADGMDRIGVIGVLVNRTGNRRRPS